MGLDGTPVYRVPVKPLFAVAIIQGYREKVD